MTLSALKHERKSEVKLPAQHGVAACTSSYVTDSNPVTCSIIYGTAARFQKHFPIWPVHVVLSIFNHQHQLSSSCIECVYQLSTTLVFPHPHSRYFVQLTANLHQTMCNTYYFMNFHIVKKSMAVDVQHTSTTQRLQCIMKIHVIVQPKLNMQGKN